MPPAGATSGCAIGFGPDWTFIGRVNNNLCFTSRFGAHTGNTRFRSRPFWP